ncbi:MAG: hypothetical protein LBC65_03245 [Oscillospiraceae bacterium]|jgi:hypothetical protein|nr:hypothetical protein [Oscillospiraceae bacterium]
MRIQSHATLIIGEDDTAVETRVNMHAALAVCSDPLESSDGRSPCGTCRNCRLLKSTGEHYDIIRVTKSEDKQQLTIDVIRAIIDSAPVMPVQAPHKVYIIRDAGDMNASASNALLKLLEEPPSKVVFLLTGKRVKDFLPTIRSRCVIERISSERTSAAEDKNALAIFEAFGNRNPSLLATECLKLEKGLTTAELRAVLHSLYRLFSNAAVTPGADARQSLLALEVILPLTELYRPPASIGAGHAAGTLMVRLTAILLN